MKELSIKAIELFKPLKVNENAEIHQSILPYSGIYWGDEIPDKKKFFKLSEEDRNIIWSIMEIRRKLWCKENLKDSDTIQWESI
ncbi:MAG: hypothetical protein GY755_23305 [Chloroflexi bacterium]|nr:hypothetical protein [Chloroflexota bacterium]